MNAGDYLRASAGLQAATGLDPWTALMRVLVLRLKDKTLPEPVQMALDDAAKHWLERPGDLSKAKAEVWRYIDALGSSGSDLETPEGRAARAVLCVLEPTGDEEAQSMTADWFASMVDD